MNRLRLVLDQLRQARQYTQNLLDHVPVAAWFQMPAGGVSHIAWQVGHLAMADYRLLLERMRGARPEDEALISAAFLEQFGRGSQPDPDPAKYPEPAAIRATLDRVRQQALRELAAVPDAELDLPPHKPHPLFTTRFGALSWCSHHEMLHAGQIGLLRRQLGATWIW